METRSRLAEIRFTSTAGQLRRMRAELRMVLGGKCCFSDELDCIVLAVNEACMNIVQHAYGATNTGEVILEIFLDENELVFRLTDFADPVDKCTIRSRDLDDIRPGGLGVHLINQVMDTVEFHVHPSGKGNILEMKKTLKGRDDGVSDN